MTTPTVGVTVWFYPAADDWSLAHPDAGQPLAAIVTKITNPETVNLAVFDVNGVTYSRTAVQLVQAGESVPGGAQYAAFMPSA